MHKTIYFSVAKYFLYIIILGSNNFNSNYLQFYIVLHNCDKYDLDT